MASGASQRSLARKYQLSHYAIGRHWTAHVSDERKASLVLGPVQRQELASRVSEESSSVIDHFRAVRAGLYQLYTAALDAGDASGGALLAGRLHENLNSLARLTGQLATSPLVQNTVINNNLTTTPEYMRLREGLLQLGRDHPQIRPDIIGMLRRLDAAPEAPPAPALTLPLLINHEEPSRA